MVTPGGGGVNYGWGARVWLTLGRGVVRVNSRVWAWAGGGRYPPPENNRVKTL